LEAQTRADGSRMRDISSDDVPESIAKDLDGEKLYCRHCGSYFVIKARQKVVYELSLEKAD